MSIKLKKVAIIIPFHKSVLSSEEKISLRQLIHFLGDYDKFLVFPKHLKKIKFKIPKSRIVYFPPQYFTSVPSYCELLNTNQFYKPFVKYEYILIYQLDSLVFSDKLLYWCSQGYDYIGAPLFNSKIGYITRPKNLSIPGCNGGFSLRRVSKFLKIIKIVESQAKRYSNNPVTKKSWFLLAALIGKSHQQWLNAPPSCYPFNEDGFWSFEAPKYDKNYKVASLQKALQFSFEKDPEKCFKLNKNQLPFGCHDWTRYNRNFWTQYLLH